MLCPQLLLRNSMQDKHIHCYLWLEMIQMQIFKILQGVHNDTLMF